jgi:hypothetical protein
MFGSPTVPSPSPSLDFSWSLPRPGRSVTAFAAHHSSLLACTTSQKRPLLSPFPATLTTPSQLIENTVTLSPVFATLTGRVKHKSFACHSYKKQGGGGTRLFQRFVIPSSARNSSPPSLSCEGNLLSPLLASLRRYLLTSLPRIFARHGPPATAHV